jgi:hypothetical protein
MGGGGAAPPVKGEDVMILIGSSILLLMFIMQAWVSPTALAEGDSHQEMKSLSKGDEIKIELIEGDILIVVEGPSGELHAADEVYKVETDGEHTVSIVAVTDAEFIVDLPSSYMANLLPYVLGLALLSFGIWKKTAAQNDEPLEAVLED